MPTDPVQLVVLVVDDDSGRADLLATLLLARGHRPHLARDPGHAFELAIDLSPDLILVDLALPDVELLASKLHSIGLRDRIVATNVFFARS